MENIYPDAFLLQEKEDLIMEEKSRYATKKKGATEVEPFWYLEDIKNMMDKLQNLKKPYHYTTFMFGLLLGRRVGDTLAMRWSDLYYENGRMKDTITTIEEQKTGKTTSIFICPMAKNVITSYIEETGLNPMDDLDDFVFPSKAKAAWKEHENADIYAGNTHGGSAEELNIIHNWVKFLEKDFSENRIKSILADWHKILKNKNPEFNCLEKYLYQLEFDMAIKSQIAAYQSAFKSAAKSCGITYNVNTHTTRKTFGYWSRKIHPQDLDSMEILRQIFNHADIATTAHYIGLTTEKKRKYFRDMGELVEDVSAGKFGIVENSICITLKIKDLMDILSIKIDKEGSDPVESLKFLMNMANELRVDNI